MFVPVTSARNATAFSVPSTFKTGSRNWKKTESEMPTAACASVATGASGAPAKMDFPAWVSLVHLALKAMACALLSDGLPKALKTALVGIP